MSPTCCLECARLIVSAISGVEARLWAAGWHTLRNPYKGVHNLLVARTPIKDAFAFRAGQQEGGFAGNFPGDRAILIWAADWIFRENDDTCRHLGNWCLIGHPDAVARIALDLL